MTQQLAPSNVTLSDIAKRAGVSQSTVSRVLNKHPRISPKTSKRVFSIVKTLGYDAQSIERKAQARAARKKIQVMRIETLLCPLPEQSDMLALAHFSKQIEGIETYLATQERAYNHISQWNIREMGNHPHNKRIIDQLKSSDGVILIGNPSDQLTMMVKQLCPNCVVLGRCGSHLNVDVVGNDDIAGGQLAAKYFIDRGFDRIGFIIGSKQVRTWQDNKHGAKLQTDMMLGDGCFFTRYAKNTDTPEVARTFEDWILSGDCPKAIILPYVESFLAMELVLAKHQLQCPEDFSLIAFGDFRIESFHIKPTIVKTHPFLTGQKGSERLVQLITDKHLCREPHQINIPMEILEGNSVLDRNQSK